jgi:hypothetical protein
MDPEDVDILREAVQTRQRKEELERAVGRTVRRRNLDFQKYVRVIADLRDLAAGKKISLEEAVTYLLSEEKKGDDKGDG